MSAVQNKQRAAGKHLKPCRPLHICKPPVHCLRRDLPAAPAQSIHDREHGRRIVELVLTEQGETEDLVLLSGVCCILTRIRQIAEDLAVQTFLQRLYAAKRRDMQGTAFFRADTEYDFHDLMIILITDDIRTCLDDPALVARDLRKRISQIICVLQAYIRDHRRFGRVDHVRGIKCSSQPHFQHHNVAVLLLKIEHADRRDELKL